jgi:hypothetical protein
METKPELPAVMTGEQLQFAELAFFLGGDSEAGESYYRHTGRRLTPEVAQAIVERRLVMSERQVADMFRVSRNTVAALMCEWERTGKLEPLKARLSRRFGTILEVTTDVILHKLRSDEVPANVLPIILGVVSDKKALLDGDPTVRVDERIEVALSPADMREMLDRMKRAQVVDVTPAQLPPPQPGPEPPNDCKSDDHP